MKPDLNPNRVYTCRLQHENTNKIIVYIHIHCAVSITYNTKTVFVY